MLRLRLEAILSRHPQGSAWADGRTQADTVQEYTLQYKCAFFPSALRESRVFPTLRASRLGDDCRSYITVADPMSARVPPVRCSTRCFLPDGINN